MRTIKLKLLLALVFSLVKTFSYAQLIVAPTNNAQTLAQKLVGDGVTISNARLTVTGSIVPTGLFNNIGGTTIGIDSGIVITSGRAKSNDGGQWGVDGSGFTPASSALANGVLNLPGDPTLANELGVPIAQLHDAIALEFDFVPLGDTIKFKYVLGSEEYTSGTVCNFNDAFGFFISGPGIAGDKNIALIPGTGQPVTITNVNNITTAPCVNNPQYYISNTGNTNFTYEGHTVIFTAVSRVQPCQRYHLKLVVADRGDHLWDTGVFLEAKSLSSNVVSMNNSTQTDPRSGLSYLAEGCVPGAFHVSRPRKDPFPLVVNLSYGGTATDGVDVLPLPAFVTIPANDSFVVVNVDPIVDLLPEGIEILKVYTLGGCSSLTPTDSTLIQIRDYDILPLFPDTAMICKRGTIQLDASAGYTTYQWMPDPTLSSTIVRDPFASPVNHNTTYVCTATAGACNAKDSVLIDFKEMEFVSKTNVNCSNGATGQIKVAGGPEWTAPVEFSLNGINWQPDSTFNNLPVGSYWVKMRDANCIDSVQADIAQAFPDLAISNLATTPAGCSGGPDGSITVAATGGNSAYQYSIDGINFQSSNVFNVTANLYTITIRDGNGCMATQGTAIALNDTVTVDAGASETICEGTGYLIPAVSNGSILSWSPSTALDNTGILNPTANPVTSIKYYLTATSGICTKKDSVEVFVRPAPVPDAGDDIDVCYGKVFQLHGNGGVSYQWSPTTHFISPGTAQDPGVKAVADISYGLMVTDIFNCRSLVPDVVSINVTPTVKIFAGSDTIVAINQPVQLSAIELNNSGVTDWSWSPAFPLNNSAIAAPVATLSYEQRLIVTGTTPAGCQGVDDILIKVYLGPDIYVPSAFTPNNDGRNDILRAIPAGMKEFKFFKVFDRSGQLIFFTKDPRQGWDGKIKGVPVSTGTFVWIAEAIDYKGNLLARKGVVTVIQ